MLASTEPDQPMQLVSQDDGKGQKKLHGEPSLELEGGGALDTRKVLHCSCIGPQVSGASLHLELKRGIERELIFHPTPFF